MQLYLIISHLNASFVFIFAPPRLLDPDHGGILARIVRRGRNTYNNNNNHGINGGRQRFLFLFLPLPAPRTKCLCPFQTPDIVVVVVMLEVAAVDVVGFSTLASLVHAFPLSRPLAYTSSLLQL